MGLQLPDRAVLIGARNERDLHLRCEIDTGRGCGIFFGTEVGSIEMCRHSTWWSFYLSTLSNVTSTHPFFLPPHPNEDLSLREDRRTSDNPIRLLIRPFVLTIDHSLRALGGILCILPNPPWSSFFPYHLAQRILGKTTRCVIESATLSTREPQEALVGRVLIMLIMPDTG